MVNARYGVILPALQRYRFLVVHLLFLKGGLGGVLICYCQADGGQAGRTMYLREADASASFSEVEILSYNQ